MIITKKKAASIEEIEKIKFTNKKARCVSILLGEIKVPELTDIEKEEQK